MGDLVKLGKAWAITGMATKGMIAASFVISALAFALGDGGTLTISWNPGGQ